MMGPLGADRAREIAKSESGGPVTTRDQGENHHPPCNGVLLTCSSSAHHGVLRGEHHDDRRQQSRCLTVCTSCGLADMEAVRRVRRTLHDDVPPPGDPKRGMRPGRLGSETSGNYHLSVIPLPDLALIPADDGG